MFEQIKLTYNYNGLEPVIDALTVETHYAKHHAAYAKNFNDAAEKAGVAEMDVEELLASLDLMKVAKQPAYTLSGGERRKLEIARALVRKPSILMLDEPFAGVDPLAVHDIQEIVRALRDQGLGIIITDHNVRETLTVVDRAYLVYDGRLLCEGTSEYLVNDEDARRLYLGEDFRM